MHATMLSELRSINPARITEVVALRNAYETLVHDVIREAQAGGALRSYISSRQLTLALLNLLNWTIFWFRFDGTMSVPELRTTLTSIFVEGAAAPAASGPPRPQRLIVRPDG